MSILTVSPASEWFEPADLIDDDDDDERAPVEALTVSLSGGWWSACGEMMED